MFVDVCLLFSGMLTFKFSTVEFFVDFDGYCSCTHTHTHIYMVGLHTGDGFRWISEPFLAKSCVRRI